MNVNKNIALLLEHKEEYEAKLTIKRTEHKVQIQNPSQSIDIFRSIIGDQIEIAESAYLLLLDRAHQIIAWKTLSLGGVNGTVIDPKIIGALSLKSLASAIVICHNHPSGNKTPSSADIKITNKISKMLESHDVNLLDHIILTKNSHLSFAEEGLL
jgi:DNA repair protein RadC